MAGGAGGWGLAHRLGTLGARHAQTCAGSNGAGARKRAWPRSRGHGQGASEQAGYSGYVFPPGYSG